MLHMSLNLPNDGQCKFICIRISKYVKHGFGRTFIQEFSVQNIEIAMVHNAFDCKFISKEKVVTYRRLSAVPVMDLHHNYR